MNDIRDDGVDNLTAWAVASDRNLAIAKGFVWAAFSMVAVGAVYLAWIMLGPLSAH